MWSIASLCIKDKVEVLLNKKGLRRILLKEQIANSSFQPDTVKQSADDLICLEYTARLRRSGLEVRLVVSPDSQEVAPPSQSHALLKAIARAQDWHEQLISGQASGPRSISKKTGLDESYVRRILGYAFLPPDIVEAVLSGQQPQDLTLEKLRRKLPMSWSEQRKILLPSAQRSSRIN